MPDKIFVDTAAWIALLNSRDTYHLPARQVMDKMRQEKAALVTTEFVLLEVADALSSPLIRSQTVNFVDNLLQLPQVPAIGIVSISRTLWLEGWTLYKH